MTQMMKDNWFEIAMTVVLVCALLVGSFMFWSLWATAIEAYVHNMPTSRP